MLQTILVPVDGSRLSEQAIPYARALAQVTGGELLFMRAVLTATLAPGAVTFNNAVRDQGREYLDSHVEAARKAGLRAQGHVWEDEAGYSILQMVEAHHPDVIVMSTHGRSALGRVVWGSVADHVLRHTPVPLLLIPKSAEGSWGGAVRLRFVVPLDGSSLAEEALSAAEELARAFNGEIALVEAIDPQTWLIEADDLWASPSFGPSVFDLEAQQERAASQYLDGVANRLNQTGITTSITVGTGRAASLIRATVREQQAQGIVMATHGRGGASRLLMGSVTDSVVRSARVPVLVIRPAAVRREASEKPPATNASKRQILVGMSEAELDFYEAPVETAPSEQLSEHPVANLAKVTWS